MTKPNKDNQSGAKINGRENKAARSIEKKRKPPQNLSGDTDSSVARRTTSGDKIAFQTADANKLESQSAENPKALSDRDKSGQLGTGEYKILLDISAAIGCVRDRDKLFAFIADCVQPVFGFNQYFNIAAYDSEQNTLEMFFAQMTADEQQQSEVPRFMQPFPVEGIFQTLVKTDEIIILGEEWKNSPKTAAIDEASASIWRDLDFKYALSVALRSFGKLVGTFHVHFFEPQNFTDNQLRLFKAISEQIAVAVSNILANEKILKSESEKSVLLSISEDISTIRNKDDLFRVIAEKIKPVFGFDDAVVFIADCENNTYYLLLTNNTRLNRIESDFHQPLASKLLPLKNSIEEWIISHEKTFICSTAEFIERFPDAPETYLMQEVGIKDGMLGVMRNGSKVIGSFHLHTERENFFQLNQLATFQSVTEQLAVAVSNILANEEILEREREKALLLSLSEDMATIRDRNDLWRVMMDKVALLLPAEESPQVFVLNPGEKTLRLLLINPSQEARETSEYRQYVESDIPFQYTPYEDALNAVAPQIFSDEYFHQKYPDYWGTKIWEKVGIKEMLSVQLRYGERILGVFNILTRRKNAFSANHVSLFKSIADQVTIAVANILANEEIAQLAEERRIRADELARMNQALQRSTLELSSLENIELFIHGVLIEIIREANVKGAAVFQVTRDGKHLQMTHYVEDACLIDIADDARLAVWREKKPYAVPSAKAVMSSEIQWVHCTDQRHSGDWVEFYSFHKMMGHHTVAELPLHIGGEYAGFLGLCFADTIQPTEAKMQLCQTLTQHAALALHFTRLSDEACQTAILREQEKAANERAAELAKANEVLRQSADNLVAAADADEILAVFLRQAVLISGASDGAVLRRIGGTEFEFVALFDGGRIISGEELQAVEMAAAFRENTSRDSNSYYAQITRGRTMFWKMEEIKEFFPEGAKWQQARGNRSAWDIPFTLRGDVAGYLGLAFKDEREPSSIVNETISALSSQIAVALEIKRLSDEAKAIAITREREQSANERAAELVKANEALKNANLEIERQFEEIKKLKSKVEAENVYLVEELKANQNFAEIVGISPKIFEVFDSIEQFAATDATVLILGETGTGKELIARAIHERSPRSKRPLIKVNCAALPRELVESELFGHERGSFTGAHERRIGKFELANGSTIFLDEIGEMPLDLQIKLLRVLQEREIERLGGRGTITLDLRVVAATNRDLRLEVERGTFRRDLYYRLNTIELTLPPLKNRREDITPLVMHFASKYAAKFSRKIESVSNEMLEEFYKYDFPGNVRELEHLVEQAVIFSKGDTLKLPRPLTTTDKTQTESSFENESFRIKTMDEMEREYLLRVLEETGGRVKGADGAAALLNLPASTLHSKLKKLGIERKHVVNRVKNKN